MKKYANLTKGDERALKALGRERLPETHRPTRAMRFTLPLALAEKLERMSKAERDTWAEKNLK